MVVNIVQKEGKHQKKDYSKGNKRRDADVKKQIFFSFLIVTVILISGCIDTPFFSSKITYEESAVQLSYKISYGYHVNLSGTGIATVHYTEYIPHSLNGTVYFVTTHPAQEIEKKENKNEWVSWNQSINDSSNQSFSVTAHIIQEPIIISDLTGESSLTIEEIHRNYPNITTSYTQSYGNDTHTIINPDHPRIYEQAETLKNTASSRNAFLLGKQIFSWLKNHTTYTLHMNNQPQPAVTTYEKGTGDCDDLTYLYLSLCRAAGIPSRYVKGYLVNETSAVSHVWAELFVGKELSSTGWIPVECAGTGELNSEIHNHYGLEDVNHLRLLVDDGTNETFNQLTNPFSVRYEPSLEVTISRFETIQNYSILSTGKLIIENNCRTYE
jgi:transglutaminase-like putative cysteine protease